MNEKQHTLKCKYTFKGKGLHTGRNVTMVLEPAPAGHGIKFRRTDLGDDAVIDALVDYVTTTARGTTLEKGDVKISTLEHLMATFNGLGVDNALVSIDAQEVPILDGSAKPYVDAICKDGLVEQDAPRKYVEFKEKIVYKDEKSGNYLLLINQSHHTPEEFAKVCNFLSEYGNVQRTLPSSDSYLEEHYTVITADNAIQSLALI